MMEKTFQEIKKVHIKLYDLFYRHQEALIEKDLTQALKLLENFKQLIKKHSQDEEEILIPVWFGISVATLLVY